MTRKTGRDDLERAARAIAIDCLRRHMAALRGEVEDDEPDDPFEFMRE